MNLKRLVAIVVAGAAVAVVPAVGALASNDQHGSPTLVQTVRDATRNFRDVNNATDYASLGGSRERPEKGAMGVHYADAVLIGDGVLDGEQARAL